MNTIQKLLLALLFSGAAQAWAPRPQLSGWVAAPRTVLYGHGLKEESIDKAFDDGETAKAEKKCDYTPAPHPPHHLKSPSLSDTFEELFADDDEQ